MLSDLKFALRALRKTPGFTAAAVLILALGIGANTSVFSVVDAVLLRPLPFVHPGELFSVHSAAANQVGLFSLPEYCDYRDQNRAFRGLLAISSFNTNLVDQGNAQLVQGLRLSADAFEVLGVRPVTGRLLVPEDDRPDAPKVAVISDGLWQRTYGGRADVIGRSVMLNGEARTIVGVLPADFIMPINGNHSDVCVPLQADSDPARHQPGALHYLRVIGRLAPGVTPAQAEADLQSILRHRRQEFPDEYAGVGENTLVPLANELVGDARQVLLTLVAAVGSLLLLASANVAGLLLVRGMARQRELAIRSALGSSRLRLIRLLSAECLVLAIAGGIVGIILAQWSLDGLLALIPAGVPRAHDVQFNGVVLGFTAAISLVAGLLPGLAPLWFCSRADLREAVSAGGRGNTAAGGQMRLRRILATVQIGLALALLACTALFLRSFWAVSAQRPGVDPTHILTARVTLPATGYGDPAALIRYYERLRPGLDTMPGVEQAGTTSLLPLATGLATVEFSVQGRPVARHAELPSANYRLVSPGYFETMGIALREGRLFTEEDDMSHPLRIIVGATLAKTFFPDHNALGQRLLVNDTTTGRRTLEIVGVVADVKQQKIDDGPTFDVYVPFRQMDPAAVPWIRLRNYVVLRSSAPSQVLGNALRKLVHTLDPSVPVTAISTMEQVSDTALAVRRFTLIVVGFLAGTALLLTVSGVYAVVAYGVAQRTREMGVRLALGATANQIVGLVLTEGMRMAGSGAILGVLAALGLSQFVAAQLYGVSPYDPTALSGAVLLLFTVATLACWIPARRAAQVDPLEAMRAD
ncbi:MAG TPA: ABC transporter permease [Opitutaceae bacterium]|nr:ABC transporter permease [Opitutaceae bacterium]